MEDISLNVEMINIAKPVQIFDNLDDHCEKLKNELK